jgi:hypothetical protein
MAFPINRRAFLGGIALSGADLFVLEKENQKVKLQDSGLVENGALRLTIDAEKGTVRLLDKSTGVEWSLGLPQVELDDQRTLQVRPVQEVTEKGDVLSFAAEDPAYWDKRREPRLHFQLQLQNDPPAILYSYTAAPQVREVQLIHNALALGAGLDNYYVVPFRMGVLVPVEGENPFSRRLIPYTIFSGWPGHEGPGYSMAMFGAVKNGSALLATWEDLYTDILYDYTTEPAQQLKASLAFYQSSPVLGLPPLGRGGYSEWSRVLRLQPLGHGSYVEIAKAYRTIARGRGFLKPFSEKVRQNPSVEQLFGAADFKPFVFSTRVPNTPWNPGNKEGVSIGYQFSDCAAFAEHMKNDLGIDRAMLVLAGWNHRGYDRQWPDILPAAPEIGGNEGLIDCSRRVQALGWRFGLHDNYRDMYKDAPSWNEGWIAKKPDQSLQEGYVWNGGQAYLACSHQALEIAARPQNLPGVKRLFAPNLYFIDTTFASPPYACFDPRHPVSLAGDVQNKIRLSEYARTLFGLFGSEEGKEWAVPHADYFEGLLWHKVLSRASGSPQAEMPASRTVIPLFELVYGDSISIYCHQDGRARPDDPALILDHILYAEMPVYYFGGPRYWTDARRDFRPAPGSQDRLVFARGGQFGLIDQFIKNTYEVLSPLNRVTALLPMTDHRFLTSDRQVENTRFGEEVTITVNYGSQDFKAGGTVLPQYGFIIESPTLVAFHARSYRGAIYAQPSLFVLRSLDAAPLTSSRQVRIYRGFGDRRLEWKGKTIEVETETIAP